MRKKDRVIIKFKCRKQKHRVLLNRKTLQNKSLDLTQLKFSGKLFVNESICHENHQLAYKCCQLKSAHKIHLTWFYNSTLLIKLVENWPIHKIFHPTDIEKVLGVIKLKKLYGPFFYGWGSTASRLQSPWEGSLLFTIWFPEIRGTHFIDLGRMKSWVDLGATQWFWAREPWIGNPVP